MIVQMVYRHKQQHRNNCTVQCRCICNCSTGEQVSLLEVGWPSFFSTFDAADDLHSNLQLRELCKVESDQGQLQKLEACNAYIQ